MLSLGRIAKGCAQSNKKKKSSAYGGLSPAVGRPDTLRLKIKTPASIICGFKEREEMSIFLLTGFSFVINEIMLEKCVFGLPIWATLEGLHVISTIKLRPTYL